MGILLHNNKTPLTKISSKLSLCNFSENSRCMAVHSRYYSIIVVFYNTATVYTKPFGDRVFSIVAQVPFHEPSLLQCKASNKLCMDYIGT